MRKFTAILAGVVLIMGVSPSNAGLFSRLRRNRRVVYYPQYEYTPPVYYYYEVPQITQPVTETTIQPPLPSKETPVENSPKFLSPAPTVPSSNPF